ncbi:hypothetical protein ACFS2C_26330 [Prauserella oleivorans]|uniref:Uncharacterized protein n=1 Tax=Prauserella oleivorans TaxID=1478153 RepID=A0ABW5WKE7_9PSEU
MTLAAAATAGALAIGTTGGLGGLGAGTAGSAADVVLSQALRASVQTATKQAARGRVNAALNTLNLRRVARSVRSGVKDGIEHAAECVTWSYGQVREFFAANPCRGLTRRLVVVADEAGNHIAVSIAWVRMPRANQARELRDLVDTQGTGSVTALGAAGARIGNGAFTGEAYTSDLTRRGRLVISEAALLDGEPDSGTLATMEAATRVAVAVPPPRQ